MVFSRQIFHIAFYSLILSLVSCGNNEPELSVNLGENQTFSDGASIELNAGNEGANYLWSTGEKTQKIIADTTGTYWVQVSLNNETKSDTIEIAIAWRTVKVASSLGDMYLWLYRETPLHKEGFLKLINEGYFNKHTFNRIIDHFVVQGGCPDLPDGFKDTSLFIAPEFRNHLKHEFGALGGGRDDNPGKKTNICQFYLVDDHENTQYAKSLDNLNGKYTVFGQVIKGIDVLKTISDVKVDHNDEPLETIEFTLSEELYTAAQLKAKFGFIVK